ncbi:MAG: DUF7146 domain-containing protein [Acidobacteriaceae bacterium]
MVPFVSRGTGLLCSQPKYAARMGKAAFIGPNQTYSVGNLMSIDPFRPAASLHVVPEAQLWWQRMELLKSERSAYLKSRGLEVPPGIRWARGVHYIEDAIERGRFDAMIGEITRVDGSVIGLHCTYLREGRLAHLPEPRKVFGSGADPAGASVRLYPIESGELGVAIGIESAIAAHMLYKVPVWAALDDAGMASFEVPPGVTTLQIFSDLRADYSGHAAAYALAHRAVGSGFDAVVYLPEQFGDWNDRVLGREGEQS